MARTAQQILKELAVYDKPAESLIAKQLAELPGMFAGYRSGLETKKQNEFRDITSRANAKGMTFSGVPISEEARYTGGTFLPALAELKNQESTRAGQLQGGLADILRNRGTLAQQIRQQELDREAQERASRASANAQSSYLASLLGAQQSLSSNTEKPPTNAEQVKALKAQANSYATRAKNSLDYNTARNLYDRLIKRSRKDNDLGAQLRAEALMRAFKFAPAGATDWRTVKSGVAYNLGSGFRY